MSNAVLSTVAALLLTRQGLVFVSSTGGKATGEQVRAIALELAELGYVLSSRLEKRLTDCSVDELIALRRWLLETLSAQLGAKQKHTPLFRSFPEGIPQDTLALWWRKVLVHFVQAQDEPCLFCGKMGTTHVLNPCQHVVCDHCFDGSSYSACPVCEHHVDPSSPFFKPSPERPAPKERVTFKRLDLGENLVDQARALFVRLCERPQALSPQDREALTTLVHGYKSDVLAWLPKQIPVRENVALVFGTLFQLLEPLEVLPHARRFLATATDVLRLLAVMSGADGSLQAVSWSRKVSATDNPQEHWGPKFKKIVANYARLASKHPRFPKETSIPIQINRFKMAKLSRPFRKALLGLLESLDADRLVEDMLRHQSYWVWAGEFLHPHEYAARYPKVARAFQIVRQKAPDGTPAPAFQTWYSKLEQTIQSKSSEAMLALLSERPGEFIRRLDLVLRLAGADKGAIDKILGAFKAHLNAFATPVLMTVRSGLSTRHEQAKVRVYWPKGKVAKGVSAPDTRPVLDKDAIETAIQTIDSELLRRFSSKPLFETCLLDQSLGTIIVPFNERTAAVSAVSLPRGSRVAVPSDKQVRLFLHWCQPEKGGEASDLDLSVGFYDEAWKYVGVCSYYELQLKAKDGSLLAQSAGDLRDAPWPDGATEFVDFDREKAKANGIRYAVMVVNNYAGMPFSQLERGFAGLMLRNDLSGKHFDPRTVELKFALQGENGVFLPLVFDLTEGMLHWLDVHAKGMFEFNNVATSNSAITKICPELMTYFASGARPSMLDLGRLHAAARCRRVLIRGESVAEYVRRDGEDIGSFYRRLVQGQADEPRSRLPSMQGPALLAMLYRGNIALPQGSQVYALFRDQLSPQLSASDLLA